VRPGSPSPRNNALSAVRDESQAGDVVIVGRPQKIDQITAFERFGNET
jgi:hypothetical protein